MTRLRIACLAAVVMAACALVPRDVRAQAKVVSSCGGQSLTVGDLAPTEYITATGLLCVSSSGGGSSTVNQGTQAASATGSTWFVQGAGTAGTPVGGVASVQGVSGGTPVPISAASLPLPTGAATSANQATEISSLATIATNTAASVPAGAALIGNIGQLYPAGSTPITASTTGTTGATTATLAANASLHTYICGFSIRANATAAATNNSTVTGTVTGTLNYTQWTAPLASGLGITEQIFSPCIISSAVNTGIAVISGAPGSGGVVSVTAFGFQL